MRAVDIERLVEAPTKQQKDIIHYHPSRSTEITGQWEWVNFCFSLIYLLRINIFCVISQLVATSTLVAVCLSR